MWRDIHYKFSTSRYQIFHAHSIPKNAILRLSLSGIIMAEKFIDIEKIIADKNPRLLKWMPGFVLRYLKRILHEDEVNAGIEANKDNYGYDFCVNIIERF